MTDPEKILNKLEDAGLVCEVEPQNHLEQVISNAVVSCEDPFFIKDNNEMRSKLNALRKPLLDWYHDWPNEPPMYDIANALYKAIEEVYGVEVVKREVPKE